MRKSSWLVVLLAALAGAQDTPNTRAFCVDHGRIYPNGCPPVTAETLKRLEDEVAKAERDVEEARYFLGIAQYRLRRDWNALMPLVEPLPPPTFDIPSVPAAFGDYVISGGPVNHITAEPGDYCNPRDSEVGRALPLCGQPEPMDVPAIQQRRCDTEVASGIRVCQPAQWTCAQKTRVLLTDEAGNRHCIKFGGTQ